MWFLDKMMRALIRTGQLVITDHDGTEYRYGEADVAPVRLRLLDKRVAAHIARDPTVGAGEAYMDGRMEVEAPHDIRDLVLFVMSQPAAQTLGPRGAWRQFVDRMSWRLDQVNRRRASSRNVRHHYDLTRRFYELFLDEDRQYSMAYYRDPENSLERAQLEKKALIAAKLRLVPGQCEGLRVLDIGGGWGGLALYLNRHFGVEVRGVSLAPDQVRFANERAEAAGVADKVRFELIDYRDVTGPFDRITSVGMLEHVGAPNFHEYFAKTHDLLADDGIMLTHTIGRTTPPGITDKWTRKYVFPGGYIPALSELVTSTEKSGWEIGDIEVLRYHYALTLEEWYRRTTLHKAEIVALYDERMFRMWQFYLAGAEQGFRTGPLVNFHLQTVKQRSALPMTRDYIQQEVDRLAAPDETPTWHLEAQEREAAE